MSTIEERLARMRTGAQQGQPAEKQTEIHDDLRLRLAALQEAGQKQAQRSRAIDTVRADRMRGWKRTMQYAQPAENAYDIPSLDQMRGYKRTIQYKLAAAQSEYDRLQAEADQLQADVYDIGKGMTLSQQEAAGIADQRYAAQERANEAKERARQAAATLNNYNDRLAAAENDAIWYGRYVPLLQNEDFAELSKYESSIEDHGYKLKNQDPEAQKAEDASNRQAAVMDSGAGFYNSGQSQLQAEQMTSEELGIYNYIYRSEGRDAANEYFQWLISARLNPRYRAMSEETNRQFAEQYPVTASMLTAITAPARGVAYIDQLGDLIDDGKIDQYAPYNDFNWFNKDVRGQVSEDIQKEITAKFVSKYGEERGKELGEAWGQFGTFGYQTAMSMVDFLVTTAAGGGFAGAGDAFVLAMMGTGAAADAVIDAKERGVSDGWAFTIGTIAGAAEIVTEKVSLETLLDKSALGKGGFMRYFAKNVLAEGSEEGASDLINWIGDAIYEANTRTGKSEWETMIREIQAANPGMSRETAYGIALTKRLEELGWDMFGGALSGGAMAGGSGLIDVTYGNVATGRAYNIDQDTVQALIDEGLAAPQGSRSRALAERYAALLDKNGKLNNWQVGRQVRANEADIQAGRLTLPSLEDEESDGRAAEGGGPYESENAAQEGASGAWAPPPDVEIDEDPMARWNELQGETVRYSLRDVPVPTYEQLIEKPDIPVVDVRRTRIGSFAQERDAFLNSARAKQLYAAPVLNRDTGESMFITPATIKHTFSNLGWEQIELAEHLPEIIENAVLTHAEPSRKAPADRTTGVYTFFGAAMTDEGVQPVKLTVKEYSLEGQRIPETIAEYLGSGIQPETYASVYDGKVLVLESIEKEGPSSSATTDAAKSAAVSYPSGPSYESPSSSAITGAAPGAAVNYPSGPSEISVKDLLALVKGDAEKYVPQAQSTPQTGEAGQLPLQGSQRRNGGMTNGEAERIAGSQPAFAGRAGNDAAGGSAVDSGGDGGRLSGERAGGPSGRVDGRAELRRLAGQRQTAADRRNTGKNLRLEAVSSRQLDVAAGTEDMSVRIMPREAWDEEMQSTAQRIWGRTGLETVFVLGRLPYRRSDGTVGYSRAANNGRRILIQCDNDQTTVTQLGDHESYHSLSRHAPGLNAELMERVRERYGEAELGRVLDKYVENLNGVYDIFEGMTDDEYEEAMGRIIEELLADAYAGINAFRANAAQFREPVREGVNQYWGFTDENAAATDRTTGPPERYSISNTRNMPWEEQIEGYFSRDGSIRSSDSLYLGTSGSQLAQHSVTDAPLYIPTSVINKATRGQRGSRSAHELSPTVIEGVQEGIETAPAVIVNPSRNALVFLTGKTDAEGGQIVVSFDLDNDLHGETAHRATSIHARESLVGLLQNLGEDATILVRDNNRLNQMLPGTEIQSLQLLAKVEPMDGSIAPEAPTVKYSFSVDEPQWISLPTLEEEEEQEKRDRYSVDDYTETRLDTAIKMLDNGAPNSRVFNETGIVVQANGDLRDGFDGEIIGRYQHGRAEKENYQGSIQESGAGLRPGEVPGQGSRPALGGDRGGVGGKGRIRGWAELADAERRSISEAVARRMENADVPGRKLMEQFGGPEGLAEEIHNRLAIHRAVAEQLEPLVPDMDALLDEIEGIAAETRYSTDDEERVPQSSAEYAWMQRKAGREAQTEKQEKKPMAESRPIIAKQDLKRNLLGLFYIPEGRRAEIGQIIDRYAENIWRKGALSQRDEDAFFDRMYAEGVMTAPADDYARAGRQAVAGGHIYVPERLKAEFGDDWPSFRRRAFGAGVLLTNNPADSAADQWNMELAESFPGIFDEGDTDERGILERIVNMAEDGKDQKLSLEDYAAYLAGTEGISEDEYLDQLERQMDWALRTFAEKAELEVRLRDRTGVKIAEEREKAAQRSAKERAAEAQRRAKDRDRRKELAQQQRENRELRELQQKTLKQLQWLSRNRQRAPEELRAAWDDVLGDIDIFAVSAANAMHWSGKHQATWRDLADMYLEAKRTDPNFLPSKELERIVSRLDKQHIADMDPAALADLYKAAVGLRTEFYNRNNVINDEEHRAFEELYEGVRDEVETADGGYDDRLGSRFFNGLQLTPMNAILRMSGWNKGGQLYSVARMLEQGERDVRRFTVDAKAELAPFLEEHRDWVKRADGQGKDAIWYEIEVPELLELGMGDKPIFGKTVKVWMTPAQKVHMYLESKSYDNLRHMAGGRTFANKELYSEGKRAEAFAQGTTIRLAPETVKKIVSDLTPEEQELARVLERYYNESSRAAINRVSNALYGYDKAIGSNYAPIFTNSNYVKSEPGVFDLTAEGVGNMKARQYSKNPSYQISAFDAFERSVDQTARFVGMAIPARNVSTLMNWREANNSMRDVLTHKWGKDGAALIDDLLTELQGGKEIKTPKLDCFVNKALSKYIQAVFGFNPSIVLKQFASYPLAAAYLGYRNMPVWVPGAAQVDTELIRKYSGELAYRTMGYATPETALLKDNPGRLQDNGPLNFLFGGGSITWMDGFTVRCLWTWAENKVRNETELQPGTQEEIDAGTDPYYRAVAKEFEEAVSRSQPMYDVMHRSAVMRDGGGIGRAFTLFKTVPQQEYNMLREAFGELRHAKESGSKEDVKASRQKAGRAVSGILIGNLMIGAITFLNALLKNKGKKYRDDEGELTAESFLEQFGKQYFSDSAGLVIGGDTLSDILGNVVAGDKWYDLDAPGIEQVNEIIEGVMDGANTVKKLVADSIEVLNDGGDWAKYMADHSDVYLSAVDEIVTALGKYGAGLPTDNVKAYLLGALSWISPEIKTAYEDAMSKADKTGLKGLTGAALEMRIEHLLGEHGIQIGDESAVTLARLYEAGEKAAIPTDAPDSVTVDGEDRKLSLTQRQTWNKVWSGIVNGALDELVSSEAFRSADAETQAKMLDRLYDYATEKAKETIFDDYEPKSSTQKTDAMIAAGVAPAEWAAWKETVSDEKRDEQIEQTLSSGMSDEGLLAAIGNLIGTDMETDIGNPTQWAKLNKAIDDGIAVEDAVRMMQNGELDTYIKWRSSDAKAVGVSSEVYIGFRGVLNSTQADKDASGKTISGSKKEKVMRYIDSLALTDRQKDALYYDAGYTESTIDEAPWHSGQVQGLSLPSLGGDETPTGGGLPSLSGPGELQGLSLPSLAG